MAKKTAPKKASKKAAATSLTPADVAALLCAMPYSDWKMSNGVGYIDSDGETWEKDGYGPNALPITTSFAKFEKTVGNLHVTIALNIRPTTPKSTWETEREFSGVQVEGHTNYNGRTFTRRGVDVESCNLQDTERDYEHSYTNLVALLDGEFARCEKAHGVDGTRVEVPGVPGGWRITPQRRAQISAELLAGRSASLTPSGFGVGYRLTRMKMRRTTLLPPATATFFDIAGPLYYETLDCD